MKKIISFICLVVCTFIWGTTFIAQDMGMDNIGPFTFNTVRFFVGFLTVLPFIFLLTSSIKALEIFTLKDTLINAFYTIFLALSVSLIIISLSLLINYSVRIKETKINLFFNKISSLGYAIPGSIIAIGILIPFTYFDNFFVNFFNNNFNLKINSFFAGSLFVLCFAYIVRFFTISQTNIESSFYRISRNIDDTARVLGKKPILI